MKQLTLSIPFQQGNYFDAFYVSDANKPLFGALRAFVRSTVADDGTEGLHQTQSFYLWGESGVGKSHLAYGVCQYAHQLGLRAGFLDLAHVDRLGEQALIDLECLDVLCWDNIDAALCSDVDGAIWAERLLHVFNRLRDAGSKLLITAGSPSHGLDLQLADLKSRLTWGLTYQIKPLADLDKVAALKLLANERGIPMPESVAQFILRRVDRHMTAIGDLLDKLDSASLSQQRKITIPFVKASLGW